jgi:hypothetical protein
MSKKGLATISEKDCFVNVSKLFKDGKIVASESSEKEKVATIRLDPEAAYATVSKEAKGTVNLGNYQSATVSVFLSVPCPMEQSQIDEAFKYVSEFTSERLNSELINIKGK